MKLVTTIVDIHMQALGNLLDVLVQVAAETGQATGIVGFEADVLGSEWCVQDGKRGPSGCCREFQNTPKRVAGEEKSPAQPSPVRWRAASVDVGVSDNRLGGKIFDPATF